MAHRQGGDGVSAAYEDQCRKTVARWLTIARGLLEQPTAPCHEELPQDYVRSFAKARPALSASADAAGNLVLKYPARQVQQSGRLLNNRAAGAPLVLVGHLDHPGFWITSATRDKAELWFKGGVAAGHTRRGCRVRFFEIGRREPTGAGELTAVVEENQRLARARARIVEGSAQAGGFAMWDFPAFTVKNGFIVSRGCDDPLGSAVALCVLDELARRKPAGTAVWGLFTRAEEVGFLGTMEALRLKTVPRNACVLSLECSKAAGVAPQGDGVAVRVGDRASIFDPDLTDALCQAAESVRHSHPGFRYQRKLMDGGTCEATPFCASGYRASGLAAPLGNYHNQSEGPDGPGIGPETVCVNDLVCEIRLLLALATQPQLLRKHARRMPAWVKERAKAARKLLYHGGET